LESGFTLSAESRQCLDDALVAYDSWLRSFEGFFDDQTQSDSEASIERSLLNLIDIERRLGSDLGALQNHLREQFPKAAARDFFGRILAQCEPAPRERGPLLLSRGQKVALAMGTLWPIVYVGGVTVWGVTLFVSALNGGPSDTPPGFAALIYLHVLTMAEVLFVLGVYVTYISRADWPRESDRTLWLLLVILGGFIGTAVFFVLKVWPDQVASEALAGHGEA